MIKIIPIFLFIHCLFFNIQSFSQTSKQDAGKPQLVVGIVVDQMRYDYVYRFLDKYGNDGFRRLVNEGFFCRNTHYNYVPTFTGPGHASIYTGTTPATHGIIANTWFTRDNNKYINCVDDKNVQAVGSTSNAGKVSPWNLLTTTITDQLRLSNKMKSKVIGIALKERGAILPAGHTANAAYWYDGSNGRWISSTYYMKELPQWVNDFNKKELPKNYLSKSWATLLSIEQYSESIADDNPYEGLFRGEAKPVFPHDLPQLMKDNGFLDLIRHTPFGNSLTKDFAIEAIKSETLGKGGYTDFMTVSFSSTDYIGHQFGPASVEIEDTYLRLDKDIAELLKFLDSYLGKNNVLVFLTADHAAADVPAYLSDNKIPAGYFDAKLAIDSLKNLLNGLYGEHLLLTYFNQQIVLNHKLMEQKKINPEEIQTTIADFMLRFKGVAGTVTASALNNCSFNEGIRSLIQNGYNQKRSGDVMLFLEPGWMEYGKTGTTHDSPYTYDTHVPLLWYGWKIGKGSSDEPVNITDIAPTLATFLNIQAPNGCTGKPINFHRTAPSSMCSKLKRVLW